MTDALPSCRRAERLNFVGEENQKVNTQLPDRSPKTALTRRDEAVTHPGAGAAKEPRGYRRVTGVGDD
jgi:hypothetical protein